MQEYDNSGALFINDRKKSSKHPDYTGNMKVNGVDYWLSAWLKVGKKGTKFLSISATPKDQGHLTNPQSESPKNDFFETNDIPF